MFTIEICPESERPAENLTWDTELDREAELKRQHLERLLEEIDELDD
jgi:hypothetical protein